MTRFLVALAALLSLCACGAGVPHATTHPTLRVGAQVTSEPPHGTPAAVAALAALPVKGRAAKTGYSREQFGKPWVDTDHNGCDTRDDILARDLVGITRDGCKVLTGTLIDPYSGNSIPFVRGPGTSSRVQIDHVVALSDAWQKGAAQWTSGRRLQFANDPRNLLATYGPLNAAKGDADAATWVPPRRAEWCDYGKSQVGVKVAYSLWVTQAEHDALARLLDTCPSA